MTVISLKQRYDGHAKRAALIAAGNVYMGRIVVVVDEDIDPSNMNDVLWAIMTRCDPQRDVTIIDASVTPDYQTRVLESCKDALCFGTTSIIGYQSYHSALMSREVRKAFPTLPIVAGGWFPSIKQDMVIEQACADVVVMGQGEITFMEVLEALRTGSSLEGIDGIAFKKNGEIMTNPFRKITDLNSLPPMPYHLINFENYFASDSYDYIKLLLNSHTGRDNSAKNIRSLYYVSSYGCPDACTFCCSPGVTQRRYTALEADAGLSPERR